MAATYSLGEEERARLDAIVEGYDILDESTGGEDQLPREIIASLFAVPGNSRPPFTPNGTREFTTALREVADRGATYFKASSIDVNTSVAGRLSSHLKEIDVLEEAGTRKGYSTSYTEDTLQKMERGSDLYHLYRFENVLHRRREGREELVEAVRNGAIDRVACWKEGRNSYRFTAGIGDDAIIFDTSFEGREEELLRAAPQELPHDW